MDMRSIVETCLPQPQTPPEVLFHYTSAEGLLGMLRSRTVWITHGYFMNDWNEFDRAVGHVNWLIEKRQSRSPRTVRALLEAIEDELQNPLPELAICIFSLSAARDLLSQWRAYCSSGGYCIGFRTSTFIRPFRKSGYLFGRCLYSDRQQYSAVSKLFSRFARPLERESRPDKRALRSLAKDFWFAAKCMAPYFKDPSFQEEREWRLASPVVDPRDLEFRVRSNKIIPYSLGPLTTSSLKEIVIGPMHEQYLAGDSLKVMLAHAGVRRCKIEHSTATLR